MFALLLLFFYFRVYGTNKSRFLRQNTHRVQAKMKVLLPKRKFEDKILFTKSEFNFLCMIFLTLV